MILHLASGSHGPGNADSLTSARASGRWEDLLNELDTLKPMQGGDEG